MSLILHITKRQQWEQAKLSQEYRGNTLESEGFIHCSTPQQIVKVANTFFKGQTGLVLLFIDSEKVQAEIKYEGLEDDGIFPHIYGALNLDAVMQVLDFTTRKDGLFELPDILSEQK